MPEFINPPNAPASGSATSANAAAELQALQRLTHADMAAVNKLIESSLTTDVPLISELSRYLIDGGGKRLRPMLAVLSARANGYNGLQHITLAAVIEFIHTATLLHDDVVDSSSLRRGRVTANQLWGNSAAVLVGDFLYSRAFQMMVTVNDMRVMAILADATNTIAAGEVMQLSHCHNPDATLESYLNVVNAKTAKLFEAAARLGAVIAHAGESTENAMRDYGRHIGVAYQLIDDVLDYTADATTLGKNIGDDLAEGKPTLPLLYALWHADENTRATLRRAVESGGREHIDVVSRAIESSGAIAYTARRASTEAQYALQSLAGLPPSAYRDALEALANFAISRTS